MSNAKPMETSMHKFEIISKDENGKKVFQKIYRSMIGYLRYLISNRPNIMYSICLCARFKSDPKRFHLKVLK